MIIVYYTDLCYELVITIYYITYVVLTILLHQLLGNPYHAMCCTYRLHISVYNYYHILFDMVMFALI